jgi:ketosteroid isomerase-like protein
MSNTVPVSAAVPVSSDDYVSIQRLVNRYADAVVHRSAEQWASCWADDAVWDLGRGRLVEGKDAIMKLWLGAMTGFAAVVQTVHSGDAWCAASSEEAVGRWAISERFRRADGQSGLLLAHYDDMYRKVEGRWLFARRFLQVHYGGPADLSAEFTNNREALLARGVAADV